MCRNITELRGLEPSATAEEIEAASRQYVRKVSGITRPTAANTDAFEAAVAEVTATTTRLLAALPPRRQPPKTVPPLRRPEVVRPARRATVSTPALKEWSAAVHAMLDGRQTVLLRKGGIHEKRFDLAAGEFVFFPTVAHGHAERVRPEHRDLLDAAGPDSTEDEVVMRAGAKVVAAVEVTVPMVSPRSRTLTSGPTARCVRTGWTSGRSTG